MENEGEIINLCISLLKTTFLIPDYVVTRSTSPPDIGPWDSLGHISLLLALQQLFNIEFSLDEMDEVHNFGEIVDLVVAKVNS